MLRTVILLLLACVVFAADEKPCTLHANRKYYDLNPLKANQDYELKTPGNHQLWLNPCRNLKTDTFGLKDVDVAKVGAVVRRDHGDFSLGELNTTLGIQDSRLRLTLSNGSICKSKNGDNKIRGSALIEFVCDTSVFGSGSPRLVGQLPPGDDDDACSYFLEWRTHYACPTNEPGGPWGFFAILAILIVGLVMVYIVFGTLYNRYVLRLRGLDQLPPFSIEGVKYFTHEAVDWARDLTNDIRGGSHTPSAAFPRSSQPQPTPTTNPVSHQSQSLSQAEPTFVRPQPARMNSGTSKRTDINPVSHQSQVQVQAASPVGTGHSPSPPPPPKKGKVRPPPVTVPSTQEEREFMLGDDEDDSAVEPRTNNPAPGSPVSLSTSAAGSAAALRGRDLGGGDVTRL